MKPACLAVGLSVFVTSVVEEVGGGERFSVILQPLCGLFVKKSSVNFSAVLRAISPSSFSSWSMA